MKKVKIILSIFIAVILVILIGGGTLVSVYAEPFNLEEPVIKLTKIKGDVSYRFVDTLEFAQLNGSIELSTGDSVKTGEGGKAKIAFFDTQEIVLDENTEITINEGFIDEYQPLLSKVKLNLSEGQIWTRLLELLHPDAEFEVEAEDVVATVRGTSFNMSAVKGEVKIAVFENIVQVTPKDKPNEKYTLEVDDVIEYKKEAETKDRFILRKINDKEKESDWVKDNIKQNDEFKSEMNKKQDELMKKVGVMPDSTKYSLKRFGERLTLAITFNKDDKAKQIEDYKMRRALEAQVLKDSGKSRLAEQIMRENGIEQDQLRNLTLRIDRFDPTLIAKMRNDEAFRDLFLNRITDERQKQYILDKLDLGEYLNQNLSLIEKNKDLIMQFMTDEQRAEYLKSLQEYKDNLPQLEQMLKELQEAAERFKQTAEEANERTLPELIINTESQEATNSNEPENPIETQPVQEPVEEPVEEPIVNERPTISSFELQTDRTNLVPGGISILRAVLNMSDGAQKDVTANSIFTIAPDNLTGLYVGSLNHNIFTANENGGKAFISARFSGPDGETFTAQKTITVLVMILKEQR
jgi:hypothetical protein